MFFQFHMFGILFYGMQPHREEGHGPPAVQKSEKGSRKSAAYRVSKTSCLVLSIGKLAEVREYCMN